MTAARMQAKKRAAASAARGHTPACKAASPSCCTRTGSMQPSSSEWNREKKEIAPPTREDGGFAVNRSTRAMETRKWGTAREVPTNIHASCRLSGLEARPTNCVRGVPSAPRVNPGRPSNPMNALKKPVLMISMISPNRSASLAPVHSPCC